MPLQIDRSRIRVSIENNSELYKYLETFPTRLRPAVLVELASKSSSLTTLSPADGVHTANPRAPAAPMPTRPDQLATKTVEPTSPLKGKPSLLDNFGPEAWYGESQ